MDLKVTIKNSEVMLAIPAVNDGKYRFKKRKSRLDFGATFSTRGELFDELTYLEWQIGYDVPAKEVDGGEKKTSVRKKFRSNKGVEKYPYELPEIFYATLQAELISKSDINSLLREIKNYATFIDENEITVEHHSELTINGMKFEETSIKLPTYFMITTPDNTQIEVSIKGQQYATGVQPMIYFCIPLTSFSNYKKVLGKSSVSGDELIYVINGRNVQTLCDLMRVFGMASQRHKSDIVVIIETLLQVIG